MDYDDAIQEGDIVDFLENTEENVFVTGKAGSGKSVQLKRFKSRNEHRTLIVAPTGIAAINCGGTTIHRTFRLPIKPIVDDMNEIRECAKKAGKELKLASTLVIDEIGMVRADTWEVIDQILRIVKKNDKPFGGIRIIAFGDLYQLPPIVQNQERDYFIERYKSDRGYFFMTKVMKEMPFRVVELTRVFRQKDDRFIAMLNSIRVGQITTDQLELLNSRYRPDFKAAEGYVTLCPRNATADAINKSRMEFLPGSSVSYAADVDPGFPSARPNDDIVTLKPGCQVMIVKNIRLEDGYIIPNGQIGIAKELNKASVLVEVNGKEYLVHYEEWEAHSPFVEGGKLKSKSCGCFRQIPLRVSYACTIHRTQGVTLEKCIIDMEGGAFADGQTYVALSRCRSLDGIILKLKLAKSDIRADQLLSTFMAWNQANGRYVEFIQDIIDDGTKKEKSPIEVINEGARNSGWLTQEEFRSIEDLLRAGNESECLHASRIVLPRMMDEIACLRTEINDLKSSMELSNA
jgi:ATP-dependent DNA helicase PIF1